MSHSSTAFLSITLAIAALSGCIGGNDDLSPEAPLQLPPLADLIEITHEEEDGHTMADLHDVATENMVLEGFHSLAFEGVDFVDGNAEVTYHDGYAYVATLGRTSGFVILDVRDPSNMSFVGHYSNPNVYSPDVKVTDDGRYALLSSHPASTTDPFGATGVPRPEEVPAVPRITDPLAYAEEDHVTGVTLVDISDKTQPVKAAVYISEPNGVHNTEYAKIDGRDIVFSVDRNNVAVLEIVEGTTGTELRLIGEIFSDKDYRDTVLPAIQSNPLDYNNYLPSGSHDVVYERHPITNDHVVHIAFGRAGYFMYNVNDPARPSMLTHWKELPADSSYYHYAAPLPLQDGRHVTVVAPEVFGAKESTGTIALLDTTDPRQPALISTWTLPGEELFIEKNYRFSPHNFDIDADARLYLANYHLGVIVLDLGCQGCLEAPRYDGLYLPHEPTDRIVDGEAHCEFWCERPFVWGVVTDGNGTLFASDVESGLYAIAFEPTIIERAATTESSVDTL